MKRIVACVKSYWQRVLVTVSQTGAIPMKRIVACVKSYWQPPNPKDDLICQAQAQWVEEYQPKKGVPGAFVLEHAQKVYGEFSASLERLDTKASELVRTSGTVATILVATLAAFDIGSGWAIAPSLFFFLGALMIGALSRRPVIRHSQASIRVVLERLPREEEDHEACLAASLHRTAEEMRIVQTWKARMVTRATFSLCWGVLGLPLVFFFWSK